MNYDLFKDSIPANHIKTTTVKQKINVIQSHETTETKSDIVSNLILFGFFLGIAYISYKAGIESQMQLQKQPSED